MNHTHTIEVDVMDLGDDGDGYVAYPYVYCSECLEPLPDEEWRE